MNAARVSTSTLDRPQPKAAGEGSPSSGEFEQLWAALRDAPARKRVGNTPTPAHADTVMVSAASMSQALTKIGPDRMSDALTAFKRDSWLRFTYAAANSVYAADLAPRGEPARSRPS